MVAYLGYTLRMKTLFVADQFWFMKRIREEEEVCFRLILCSCSEVQNFECYRSNTVVNRIESRFIYVNQIELKYFFSN